MAVYTVHVDFLADDDRQAGLLASSYVEALNTLRPEIETRSAQLSPSTNWRIAAPVFCNEPSGLPDEACTDNSDHPGRHSWRS